MTTEKFNKVLIANRGEIAVRICRTLKEMGIKSVAVYSEADRDSMHVRAADEAVCIGPASSKESYLNIDAIVSAAKITNTDAIHPGYGFLSENPKFSKAVTKAGIVFIGPTPEAIEALGVKSAAREIAIKAGVPVIPGSDGIVGKNYKEIAKKIGFPIMIKATMGGGGKGMRAVMKEEDLDKMMQMAQNEARAAFGDDRVYFEKLVLAPRHIEVQVAADAHGNVLSFTERDCSMQRRHQKLVEESPSPFVTPEVRKKLTQAASKMIKACQYTGVGTVEFLMDQNKDFYFMEVNTRLQVEHPVTEMVCGYDLVKMQIDIAQGKKLQITPEQALQITCHAIEHRINAEDCENNFAPNPGLITEWIPAGGLGVRVDTHMYTNYTIPSYYDSLIAKLIVWAPSRERAISRAKRALSEFHIGGIKTTIPVHNKILNNKDFASGNMDTGLLERIFKEDESKK
ncbi:Acetyl-CoA carboxylase, biotin carboxylase [Elusimicrobium minutum Pei191]|uniref:Biotin carboxylase n=1 Tax=Elusimicrobium minutum (strain Pei191) TaxID=445932 RepID=B2KDY7_ELUMP|nr:acetyl-CoA carboxylase biotin carboxylase subunit [Elusimicrobium minutum]ACC98733.1 Acetyl-CoA carboxylase, biotin carboxylase [Elusimicrobium minutum Pei191]